MPASEVPKVVLTASVRSELDRLREMLKQQCTVADNLEHCSAALRDLDEIFRNLRYFTHRDGPESGHVCRWMVMVTKGYKRYVACRFFSGIPLHF